MSRMTIAIAAAGALALTAGAARARAQSAAPADTGSFTMRDFRFASGETLPELRLFYRTLGRPRRDAAGIVRNAVLILHGTGGSGQGFLGPVFAGQLFGPGQPLDTARTYVIIPDNLGHGRSTKPSDGLHARFPRYAYEDMVGAQYRLVTEGLGVNHLRLVMGTSMGCMHSWLWGVRWPQMMDALFPLACLPAQISGRNRMWRKLVSDAIRGDPAWQGGDYAAQPPAMRVAVALLWIVGSAPLNEQRLAPTRDSADAYITRWVDQRLRTTDANDLLYAVEASRDYDPSADLGRITAPVVFVNSADDVINPPELGIAERLIQRVPRGRFILLPITPETRGHGTHTVAAIWKPYLVELLEAVQGERE